MSLSSGIQRLIKQKLDTVLIAMKMSNQSVVARSEVGREAELAIDEVYLHYQDQQIKLKITKEIE
ncbi:hypothetical protein [Streptococcus suis]|nr:hypothetical protein [Streptococcus suis]CYW12650.1 reticulocyte binding protein [Streptococcus suis]